MGVVDSEENVGGPSAFNHANKRRDIKVPDRLEVSKASKLAERVLKDCGDDKREAARRLGLALSSLYRKLEELDSRSTL